MVKRFLVAVFSAMSVLASAAGAPERLPDAEAKALFAQAEARGLDHDALLLVADTAVQRAYVVSACGNVFSCAMSSAKAGVGNESGSNKTPLGWHAVAERFGANASPGTVFVSRRPDGRVIPPELWSDPAPAEDFVLTRVLWLRGLEPGLNQGGRVDSHARCIYIHGTNQEQLLGTPASHGCLRLSNADVVKLFDFSEGVALFCLIR